MICQDKSLNKERKKKNGKKWGKTNVDFNQKKRLFFNVKWLIWIFAYFSSMFFSIPFYEENYNIHFNLFRLDNVKFLRQ